MFVSRRRIGTPRAPKTGRTQKEFHQNNEGHTIRTQSPLPPIIREALALSNNAQTTGMINAYRQGTCGFIISSQLFIWTLNSDSGDSPADVLILDLPSDDSFVSFTGNSNGVFSCSKDGVIQYWPSFLKAATYNMELPLAPGASITSMYCNENFCWIGSSDGKIAHLRIKRDNNSTLELIRHFSKSKGVFGRMFSWGWASQQTSPIIKLHINSMIEEGKDWLYILTERGAEIWNSSEKEDVIFRDLDILKSIETLLESPVELIDCQKLKKSLYVLVRVNRGSKDIGLAVVRVMNAFSDGDIQIKKPHVFQLPSRFDNRTLNSKECNFLIIDNGASIIMTPTLLIATEMPVDKEPLVVEHRPLGIGLLEGKVPLVITTKDLLRVDITRVIKSSDRQRTKIKPDNFTQRFELYLLENRVEEFAKTEDRKVLSELVTRFSLSILDDKNTENHSSLLLHQRLTDKNEKHRKFIEFLRLSKTLEYLSVQAKYKLLVHMEKMEGAMSLHECIHNLQDPSKLIKDAMKNCYEQRQASNMGQGYENEGYTLEDNFFAEVSKVDQIIDCVRLDELIREDTANAGRFLYESNLIYLSVLYNPWQKRLHFCGKLGIDGTEYTTSLWNFSDKIRNRVLIQNSKYTGPYILTLLHSGAIHSLKSLADQLSQLDVFLLDTYQFELDENSLLTKEQKTSKKEDFEKAKYILILKGPFLEYDKNLAKDLAERFLDFNTITELCDTERYPQNIIQLNPYLLKYKHKQYPAYVYKYFQDKGKYNELLGDHMNIIPSALNDTDELSVFLQPHSKYSWLHGIRVQKYKDASDALLQEAFKEVDNTHRRSILLGLSKLTHLASNTQENYSIDHSRYLNDYQKIHDPENTVPQPPSYYINGAIQRGDFIDAIELFTHTTELRSPEENNDQVFTIWSNCIRADDWKGIAKVWATNEINDKTVQENIETSFIATLCNSESARGCWNRDFLGIVMKDYLTSADITSDIDEDSYRVLERLMLIVHRFCVDISPK